MGSCSSSSKRKSNRNDEIYNAIFSSEEFQDTLKYNTRGNQDKSAVFVGYLEDEIGKYAFQNGIEITTRDVENIKNRLFDYLGQHTTTTKEINQRIWEEEKTRKAKEYFKNNYKGNVKVNGYGEKTNREITTLTYKRATARMEKAVDDWFGIKKK